jgi:chromosomal replication initiator protein DnaA
VNSQRKKPAEEDLPLFFQECVEQGIVDQKTAFRIEEFRQNSGVGVARALHEFGLSPQSWERGQAGSDPSSNNLPLLQIPPNPRLTFDSFFPCKANSFPLDVARLVAREDHARLAYNPLYLYSDVGLGKTHLLSAIANTAQEKSTVYLFNTADLDVEYERICRRGFRAEFRKWFTSASLLLIDDIQLCEGNEALQRELFAILNHMLRSGNNVVISSDVPPTRLHGIEERLLSRLGAGVIVGLNMANKAERIALLQNFLQDQPIPLEVFEYLAEQVTDSIRHLKAVAKQLSAMCDHLQIEINLHLARAIVPLPQDLAPSFSSHRLSSPSGSSPHPAQNKTTDLPSPSSADSVAQIGRASCRERV